MIGSSGATVRRWESGRAVPDSDDLAKIAAACSLTPLQYTFLTLAFSRIESLPPPPEPLFRQHVERLLSGEYPAIVWDSLFYQRAWNSYTSALTPESFEVIGRQIHPIAMLMRTWARGAAEPQGIQEWTPEQRVRQNIRFFWLSTAHLSSRPAYRRLINTLRPEPRFEELWRGLAFENESPVIEPTGFAHVIARNGARFRLNTRTIAFPAIYTLWEYIPDDDLAWQRLRALQAGGPPQIKFSERIHWECTTGACKHSYEKVWLPHGEIGDAALAIST